VRRCVLGPAIETELFLLRILGNINRDILFQYLLMPWSKVNCLHEDKTKALQSLALIASIHFALTCFLRLTDVNLCICLFAVRQD
jgi:hypothetical protein